MDTTTYYILDCNKTKNKKKKEILEINAACVATGGNDETRQQNSPRITIKGYFR